MSETIKKSERDYHAVVIGQGFDTIVESYNVVIPERIIEDYYAVKDERREKKNNYSDDERVSVKFGNMDFQLRMKGANGVAHILINDLYTVDLKKGDKWALKVKYSSAGLWQFGYLELRSKILKEILQETKPLCSEQGDASEWQRISQADYAIDIYSPEFSEDFTPAIVDQICCHSSSKVRFDCSDEPQDIEKFYVMGTSKRPETLTIGSRNSLQIQVYDKIKEIKDRSGKDWMYKIWEREGFYPSEEQKKHVWRLEARMYPNFLRDKNINIHTPDDLIKNINHLVEIALRKKQLKEKSSDTNKSRQELHPFWREARAAILPYDKFEPLGALPTKAAEETLIKIKQDIKAALRRHCSIVDGIYDEEEAATLIGEILREIKKDDDHDDKMSAYNEKYKYIHAPK